MRRVVVGLVAALVCAMSGCAAGGRVPRPHINVPAQWTAPSAGAVRAGVEPKNDRWWEAFQDRELASLIQRAISTNYDLKVATGRVIEARSLRSIAGADYYPQVSGTANANRDRVFTIATLPSGATRNGLVHRPFSFQTNGDRGQLDSAWELDLFGRIRNNTRAATEDLVAAEQDRRFVLIALIADVVRSYTDLRDFQARLSIAQQNITIAQDAVHLTESLVQAGQVSERDVAQAQVQLESLQSNIPTLKSGIALSQHRISTLVAVTPEALEEELSQPGSIPAQFGDVPIGLPTDLLERRPDVRRAEAQVASALARTAAARAEYFPRVMLLGTAGRQATQLHDLTLGIGNFFSFGPTITLPIFTGGRIRSNIAVEGARAMQATANYESTILTALQETEDALVNYANELERRTHLEAAVRADHTALDLAKAQYQAGLTDFLTVLDAERDLYTNEDLLAQSRAAVTNNLVSLYKALGGGWSVSP